jgi:cytochrome c oxidase accessory protein FixG
MSNVPTANPTAEVVEIPLYERRRDIYQKEISGKWQRMRTVALFVLAGIYVFAPWLQWGERQAVLWDLPARKFHIFGVTFWPQDFILLSWLMITGAFGLFFFTNLAGRLWCGYGCPQTVWTKFFMWIEWLTEGDRNDRIRLDRGPWTGDKIRRKTAKHAAWVFFALIVGTTFYGYFTPIRPLVADMLTFDATFGQWFAVFVFSAPLYLDAGFMREQICKYACPYARFQGAMFDENTLTVFYDTKRGEPRGHRGTKVDHKQSSLGDCIDCNLCVQVCPTGIDIRQGTQYECIGCAACIDACDEIMDKMKYPRGLVRYATEKTLEGKPYRLLRPRLFAYASVFGIMLTTFAWGLVSRVPLELDIIRERGQLFRETPQGDIENVYRLRVLNMDQQAHTYRIEVGGIDNLRVVGEQSITVPSGEIADVPLRLQVPAKQIAGGSTPVTFTLATTDDAGWELEEESRFMAPARH